MSLKCIVYTQFMVASAPIKQILYPLMSGWPQLLSWNKETVRSVKKCSLRLNTAN